MAKRLDVCPSPLLQWSRQSFASGGRLTEVRMEQCWVGRPKLDRCSSQWLDMVGPKVNPVATHGSDAPCVGGIWGHKLLAWPIGGEDGHIFETPD